MEGQKNDFHREGGRLFFASRRPKFEPVSQSIKRMGNNLQRSTVEGSAGPRALQAQSRMVHLRWN
jgi:hypothetical protein